MSSLDLVDSGKGAFAKILGRSKLPWTPRAHAVLEDAQKKAREDGVGLVGSEHLLLGSMSVKDCLGATILGNLGVTPAEVSRRYEQLRKPSAKRQAGEAKPSEDIEKVIQCAAEQAVRWGHKYIGAEHLLMGILLVGEGVGFQMLTNLGITLEKVIEETQRLIVCRNVTNERKEQ